MLLCLLLCFSFNNELKCKSWRHKWLVSMVCLFGLAWHLVWIERIWVKIHYTLQCIACLWEKDNAQMDSVIDSEVFMSQAPTKWSRFSLLWKNNDWCFLKMTACLWHPELVKFSIIGSTKEMHGECEKYWYTYLLKTT